MKKCQERIFKMSIIIWKNGPCDTEYSANIVEYWLHFTRDGKQFKKMFITSPIIFKLAPKSLLNLLN